MAGTRTGKTRAHRGTPAGPEPSARDLEIYRESIRGTRLRDDIGREYQISGRRVSQICEAVEKYLAPLYKSQIDRIRARHTDRLEYLYREAVMGFARSQQDEVTIQQTIEILEAETAPVEKGKAKTEATPAQPKVAKEKRKRRGQAGAPAFITAAAKVLEDIRSIWGADIPPTHDPAGHIRVAGKTLEEVKAEAVSQLRELLGAGEN